MRLASYVAAYCVATLFSLSVVSSGGCGSAKAPTSPTVTAGFFGTVIGEQFISVHSGDGRLFIDGTVVREKSIQGLITLPQAAKYQFTMTR